MQAWKPGTPSAPLLFFLQEQQPPELSPVAGDRERAPSSRYQRHQSQHFLPLLHLPVPSLLFPDPLYPGIPPLPLRREELTGEERRRPDTLQLWQERERRQQQQQQQQSGLWGALRKDRYGHRGYCWVVGPESEWK